MKARGFEPLIDRTEIFAFEEWWKRIEALIAGADTVVFILSSDSVASDVAQREVSFAASLNKRFAPVVCRRVDDTAVPEALAKLHFIFFDDEAQFEESANRLAQALKSCRKNCAPCRSAKYKEKLPWMGGTNRGNAGGPQATRIGISQIMVFSDLLIYAFAEIGC